MMVMSSFVTDLLIALTRSSSFRFCSYGFWGIRAIQRTSNVRADQSIASGGRLWSR
jgi:hypothetical protein